MRHRGEEWPSSCTVRLRWLRGRHVTPRCPKAINRPPRSESPLGASPASAPRLVLYNQRRVPVDPGSAPEVSPQSETEYPPEPAISLSSPVGSLTLPRIARPSFDNGQCGTA